MPARVQLSEGTLRKVVDRLIRGGADFTFLAAKVESIVVEDHTRAILMGVDKDGVSFTPVTYRNDGVALKVGRNRYNRGVGPELTEPNDNLSSAAYRRLKGPPLAPRGKDSRILANFKTRSDFDGTSWNIQAALIGVVDAKGRPFMQYHFEGRGRLPRRDDRGIRPWGREEIRKAIQADVTAKLKGM